MLKQDLSFKLQQKLSPQQIQLMKLVQLHTLEFEERLIEELEENPALEDISSEFDEFSNDEFSNENDFDEELDNNFIDADEINIDDYITDDEIPYYKTVSNNYSENDSHTETIPYASGITLYEHLISQIHTIPMEEEEEEIATFLIGSIDEDGYIRRPLSNLSDDLMFSQNIFASSEQLEYILTNYIHKLEPIGVGSRDLSECLLIQLYVKEKNNATNTAISIIENRFEEFSKKHFTKIQKILHLSEEELKQAIKEIEKLNPKPGKAFSENTKIVEQITPDFTITIIDGSLDLKLNSANSPELRISQNYREMFETYRDSANKKGETQKAVMFIKQKIDAAKWFIDAVKQRENTLMMVMGSILEYQKEYFLTGDEEKLRPMILKDIAEIIQMDISTVSRVVNSKYVNTPYGTMLIKNVFSEAMTTTSGEEVSTREIKKILEDAIASEDKKVPLTDDKIVEILIEKGYKVARRTIAKYREQLNIPVARLRKEL